MAFISKIVINKLISCNNNNNTVRWFLRRFEARQPAPLASALPLVTLRDASQHGRQSAAVGAPRPLPSPTALPETHLTSKARHSEFPPSESNYILSTKGLEFYS